MINKFKKRPLPLHLKKIRKELKSSKVKYKNLTSMDVHLVQQIKTETEQLNLNNLTRTKSYLDFFLRHQEIHWAFLAHMVSRNAGWNMTDLKGSFLPHILSKNECESFFTFIERGNWLIFQDAYPQLRLYEESIKQRKNLFYLLQEFHVSVFMESIWNAFWEQQDYEMLATALIINEQNYLQVRVLNNKDYIDKIFGTLEFKLQDILSLNHIIFPFVKNNDIELAGLTVHHFESLNQRILLGKRLYELLFNHNEHLKNTIKWAKDYPHTGSRKDFWPHLFNVVDESVPGSFVKKRLYSCSLRPSKPRFYSPKLENAWKNVLHEIPPTEDWYDDWRVLYYLTDFHSNTTLSSESIKQKYCRTLELLDIIISTKETVSSFI